MTVKSQFKLNTGRYLPIFIIYDNCYECLDVAFLTRCCSLEDEDGNYHMFFFYVQLATRFNWEYRI